jgi:tRNA-splicing endonuclease subunit Sen34
LWQQGFFVSCGSKFGGDFLVYPGDPSRFHAEFVAIVVAWAELLSPLQLSSFGRLGTAVKKTPLLCAVDDTGMPQYLSLRWAGNA